MNRQDFIKECGVYCLGAAGLTSLLASCSSYYYAQHSIDKGKLAVRKTEFMYQKGEDKLARAFVLIKPDTLEFPVCLYRFGNDEFTALYLKCTHQGCEVQPHQEYLVCPCHGSEFSNRGAVIHSPAEQDLQQFPVSYDGETIFIQLR